MRGRVAPGLGVVLQRPDGDRPLGLDDGADVHPGSGQAEGELDGQLVPGRVGAGHRGSEPGADFGLAGRGDAVDDVAFAVAAVFADQAVAFQPVQGGVDLPDVQRPGGPGAVLEFGPELVAVARRSCSRARRL